MKQLTITLLNAVMACSLAIAVPPEVARVGRSRAEVLQYASDKKAKVVSFPWDDHHPALSFGVEGVEIIEIFDKNNAAVVAEVFSRALAPDEVKKLFVASGYGDCGETRKGKDTLMWRTDTVGLAVTLDVPLTIIYNNEGAGLLADLFRAKLKH